MSRLRGLAILALLALVGQVDCGTAEPRHAPASSGVRPTTGAFTIRTGATGRTMAVARGLVVELPRRADDPMRVGEHVRVRRRGALPSEGRLVGDAVVYEDAMPGVDATVFPDGFALEELLTVHDPASPLAYDIELPAAWRTRIVDGAPRVLEILDGAGAARMRVSAERSWDAAGADVELRMRRDRSGFVLSVAAGEEARWPVTVDPAFVDASVPLKLRQRHTATLLADGRVLVVGGGTSQAPDATAEVFDPARGTFTSTGAPLEARASHAAILLPDGKVLVAGGAASPSAELYDPASGAFSDAPGMNAARSSGTATRLASGGILLAGGDTTAASAEIYDPAAGTFTLASPMLAIRAAHAAARVADGRVLVAGGTAGPDIAEIFDPAANGGAGAFLPAALGSFHNRATTLRDGRVLVYDTVASAELFDPLGETFTTVAVTTAVAPGASLLPSGEILSAGGTVFATVASVDVIDATVPSVLVEEPMSAPRVFHTATLLPTGDVLLLGGEQASTELYVKRGGAGPGSFAATGPLAERRLLTGSVVLHDGRFLVVGGSDSNTPSAEVFDPATGAFTPTGPMSSARLRPATVLLADGRVLVACGHDGVNGGVVSADVFDPATNAFTAVGPTTAARNGATATLLPSGQVLLAGGTDDGSAEIFDPVAGTFAPTGSMTAGRNTPGAALLPNGKVLVVGGTTADLYDPISGTFAKTDAPGTAHLDDVTVTVLASGRALVAGGETKACELYDPETETFGFTGPASRKLKQHAATLLPSGKVILTGGIQDFTGVSVPYGTSEIFDPTANGGLGAFHEGPALASGRATHAAGLLADGSVILAGGFACSPCFPSSHDAVELWKELVGDESWRPIIGAAPAAVQPGTPFTVTGSALVPPPGGGGDFQDSPVDLPSAVWLAASGSGIVRARAVSWSDSSATFVLDATALRGKGRLYVVSGGIASHGALLDVGDAPPGTPCAFDAGCAIPLCIDGVCCNSACEGPCETCNGVAGAGTCGPLAEAEDPDDGCFLVAGAPCTSDDACATGLCVDGHCCTGACPGQCEACDVQGHVGTCVPVVGAAHGARPACDTARDPCDSAVCDGREPLSCEGKVGPCGAYACAETACKTACAGAADCAVGYRCQGQACIPAIGTCDGWVAREESGENVDCRPYACEGAGQCKKSCADVGDCAPPFVCDLDGTCVPPVASEQDAGCGCRSVGDRRGAPGGALALIAGAVLLARRRRRAKTLCAATLMLAGCGAEPERADDALHTVAATPAGAALAAAVAEPSAGLALRVRREREEGAMRSVERELTLRVDARSGAAFVLSDGGPSPIEVHRRKAGSASCVERGAAIACAGVAPGIDSVVLIDGASIEELLVVRSPDAEVAYEVRLAAGWSFAPSADGASSIVRDASGGARVRLTAERAWDAAGRVIAPRIVHDDGGFRVEIDTDARTAWPVVVDPAWTSASVPSKLRAFHTATRLADGRVFFAGGSASGVADGSTDVFDLRSASFEPGPPLLAARALHTATLLPDGRVWIAGGFEPFGAPLATTELYDPGTGTLTPGPMLTVARAKHTATRLADERILLAGGGTDQAEVFDPATGQTTPTGSLSLPCSGHTATLLQDGRVLIVGDGTFAAALVVDLYDPALGSFSPVAPGPTPPPPFGHTATLLRDGRVLVAGATACFSSPVGCQPLAAVFDPAANGGAGGFTQTLSAPHDHISRTATLLQSGHVLLTGGNFGVPPASAQAQLFDPATNDFVPTDAMSDSRADHTATMLASGEVLVVGGDQASADLFVARGAGAPGSTAAAAPLGSARTDAASAALPDGSVLVAGGYFEDIDGFGPIASVEKYDVALGLFVASGPMSVARRLHTMTPLIDGRLLVTGGEDVTQTSLASAEIHDPVTGAFSPAGTMSSGRARHTATLLPGGKVLVAGGHLGLVPQDTAEVFDPAAGTFTPTSGSMAVARQGHAAVLLPTGRVLVVGGTSAELYDPSTNTFEPTSPPGATYAPFDGVTATLLGTGNVLVAGTGTLASELYDPVSGAFAFTAPGTRSLRDHRATLMPSGHVLVTGGSVFTFETVVLAAVELFDPAGGGGLGGFSSLPDLPTPKMRHSGALLPSGSVLVAGGIELATVAPATVVASAATWAPVVGSESWRPVITGVPATVVGGTPVAITGTGFRAPESSGGRSNASSADAPLAVWMPATQQGLVTGALVDVTAGSATWRVAPTALHGPGRLHVIAGGIASDGVPVVISAAALTTPCLFDGQCASGHCASGVCCDQACEGLCESCTAAGKGSGADGACGPIPAALSLTDACELFQGARCATDDDCVSGFCKDAVCCDGSCDGQCEACDVDGFFGVCTPVVGAPHGARPPCEEAAEACDNAVCDGTTPDACTEKVGPCEPYACDESACKDDCGSDADCAPSFACNMEESECVPAGTTCDGQVLTTPDGAAIDCTPFACDPAGTCRTTCDTVADCAIGYACDTAHRCAQIGSATIDDAGCGCVAPGSGRPERPVASLVALLAAVLVRIRTRSSQRRARPRPAVGPASIR